jgi:hypothetical protein
MNNNKQQTEILKVIEDCEVEEESQSEYKLSSDSDKEEKKKSIIKKLSKNNTFFN